ncbi:N-acetylmuramic acid 6-phosphate etherase [Amylibacter ulvae]|uniref:N-acetylmuramic acid 6-phosphate etherase n=1 Tax=Paramylibacter ulvae TaxID=1651968 RepID=A0ABQ3CU57_9RHOB|nr:N-acetylmuramic acid 6-phosphate etherase [Amylibacter ulvae]GHA41634.1 N-acetylmuramic acid 6-phosphate etherase [Amylibacter ulvae]
MLPQTEQIANSDMTIDAVAPLRAVSIMLDVQRKAIDAVNNAIDGIIDASNAVAQTVTNGGTIHYVAAGSSGLMALADGAELPGTFGIAQNQIRIHMAGGVPTDGQMPGNTEDDISNTHTIVEAMQSNDCVIAISASGTTPFAYDIAQAARAKGINVIAIANNADTALLKIADVAICLSTPPEALAGSTRMGAGTAQKVALNLISTQAGILLGHVHDGQMINLIADNAKLRQRAINIVGSIADVSNETAALALRTADGNTKHAILIAKGCPASEVNKLLATYGPRMGDCLLALNAAKTAQT